MTALCWVNHLDQLVRLFLLSVARPGLCNLNHSLEPGNGSGTFAGGCWPVSIKLEGIGVIALGSGFLSWLLLKALKPLSDQHLEQRLFKIDIHFLNSNPARSLALLTCQTRASLLRRNLALPHHLLSLIHILPPEL